MASSGSGSYTSTPTARQECQKQMDAYFGKLAESLHNQLERCDDVIFLSREITRMSKDAISTILRAYQNNNPAVMKLAEEKIEIIQTEKFPLFLDMSPSDSLEYFRFRPYMSPCIQEFIEALGLYHFIKTKTFLTYEAMVKMLKYKGDDEAGTERGINVTYTDFILGMLDVFGELTRLCTALSDPLDKDFLFRVLHQAQQFRAELITMESLIQSASVRHGKHDFRNKISTLKSSILKIAKTLKDMKLTESDTLSEPKLLDQAIKKYFLTPPKEKEPQAQPTPEDE